MILKKVKAMLGFNRRDERPNPDPIRADVTRALQANERAAGQAQRALEELLADKGQMRQSIGHIVGKM